MPNPKCPECGSQDTRKAGWKLTRKGRKQLYFCKSCALTFGGPLEKKE